jgi:hypothetical protein
MSSTSVATDELIDERLDTIDRALMGLMPRRERLKFLAETEVMLRDRGVLNSVLAEELDEAQEGLRSTALIPQTGRRGRSRLALASGVLGIVAAVLLFAMPVTYIVVSMAGEAIGEMASYALLGLNVLAVALGGATAVILGIAALVRLSRRHSRQVGHGWAITGLCAGPVPMLLGGLAMLFVVLPMTGVLVSEYRAEPVAGYVQPSNHQPSGNLAVPASHEATVPASKWDQTESEASLPSSKSIEPRQLDAKDSPADSPSSAAYTPPSATEPPSSESTDTPENVLPPLSSPGNSVVPITVRYALHNAAVTDVAAQLAVSLETASNAMATDPESNTLTVTALPKEQERISQLLVTLDAKPIAVEIRCQLTRIGPDGQRTILSKPQVQALDGTEAMISIGSADESIEVTLVPKVILPEQVKDTIEQAPLPDGAGGDGR